jgi:KDO2-lipid IV(A) lauroyltransferase
VAEAADDRRASLSGALTVGRYRVGSFLARVTPAPVSRGTAAALAPGLAAGLRDKRSMIERHLRRVDPSLSGVRLRRASQAAFDSYMRYWIESFRLPTLSSRHVDKMFEVEGFAHIEEALERGRGVVLALPHLGGWEWAGRWMTDRGHKMTVVVEPLEPPELLEWFTELRRDLGMNVVPLGAGAAPAVLSALRANEVVCLLCDRDIQGGGVEVDFFGERTTLPAGPAMLAVRADSTVLPTAVYFSGRGDGHRGGAPPARPPPRRKPPGGRDHDHPTTRSRARIADSPGSGAVAPLPAQLAERSRLRGGAGSGVGVEEFPDGLGLAASGR